VPADHLASFRPRPQCGRREDILLPDGLSGRRIFLVQRPWERGETGTSQTVVFTLLVDLHEMGPQWLHELECEDGGLVFPTLTGSHGDCFQVEIDILNPELNTLIRSQARAVDQGGHQPSSAGHLFKDIADLIDTRYSWQKTASAWRDRACLARRNRVPKHFCT